MFSVRCGLEALSFCACQRSECSPPSGSQYRHLCGRVLLWASVRTLVPQRPGASARGHSAPAWTPIASPLFPPGSVLHGRCPDAPSWGGTRGSGWERWFFLSVDSLGGRSLSSSTCPDPGEVFRASLPRGLPGFISRSTGCGEGFCHLLGLSLLEWRETALLRPQQPKGQSTTHDRLTSPYGLENGSPAWQTSSQMPVL